MITLQESILSKTDGKVAGAKDVVKEQSVSDLIHKCLPQLSKLYLGLGSRWEFGSDNWGTPIHPGDTVLFMENTFDIEDLMIGVVASHADKNGCHIVVTGKAAKSGGNPDDLYDDCIQHLVPGTSMVVLAHEKDTKKILDMIIKLLK